MKKMNLYVEGLIHAGLAGAYVSLVATFMSFAPKIFGEQDGGILGFTAFLLIFVISATVMALLVLGKPVMMYLDGKKNDAIKLLGITIGWMVVIMIGLLVLKVLI